MPDFVIYKNIQSPEQLALYVAFMRPFPMLFVLGLLLYTVIANPKYEHNKILDTAAEIFIYIMTPQVKYWLEWYEIFFNQWLRTCSIERLLGININHLYIPIKAKVRNTVY